MVITKKPGRYKIEISASGFQMFTTSGVVLVARQTLRVDAALGTGQVTAAVDITSNAGVITTETQTISSSFGSQKILNLPANYRAAGSTSPYILIASLPGVQADNGNNFSIQGALPSQSQFSLDGISTTNVRGNAPLTQAFPSAESIAEIKVQGVGNAAEYGQVGDVTTISKSGTNDYHATAFRFHQNRALDSKAFGALTKPQKIANDFGGRRAADLYNRQAEYGNDYATRRHRLISTAVYDLPFGRGRRFGTSIHPAINAVVGGWQLSGIFLVQTGPYLTPTVSSVDPSGSGSGLSYRPGFDAVELLMVHPTIRRLSMRRPCNLKGLQGLFVTKSPTELHSTINIGALDSSILMGAET